MRGQRYDRVPGVERLLAPEGPPHRRELLRTAEHARTGLAVLHRSVEIRPEDVEVVITPDLVADLHDPTLVISPDYVGPDRRSPGRPAPSVPGASGWYRRARTVVVLTVAVVVPLTVVAGRSVPPAARQPPSTPAGAPATAPAAAMPKVTAGGHRSVLPARTATRHGASVVAAGRHTGARTAAAATRAAAQARTALHRAARTAERVAARARAGAVHAARRAGRAASGGSPRSAESAGAPAGAGAVGATPAGA